jgi:hypothetical protein
MHSSTQQLYQCIYKFWDTGTNNMSPLEVPLPKRQRNRSLYGFKIKCLRSGGAAPAVAQAD